MQFLPSTNNHNINNNFYNNISLLLLLLLGACLYVAKQSCVIAKEMHVIPIVDEILGKATTSPIGKGEVRIYVCMYVCMYVCIYIYMYVYMYVYMYICTQ